MLCAQGVFSLCRYRGSILVYVCGTTSTTEGRPGRWRLKEDVEDLSDFDEGLGPFGGDWNDKISSVEMARCYMRAWEHAGEGGASLTLYRDIPTSMLLGGATGYPPSGRRSATSGIGDRNTDHRRIVSHRVTSAARGGARRMLKTRRLRASCSPTFSARGTKRALSRTSRLVAG